MKRSIFVLLIVAISLIASSQAGESISGTMDFTSITPKLKAALADAGNQLSFIVQKKDGTILTKQHLSTDGTALFDDDTTLHIASGVKWVAMATIMSLVEDGTLSLTDTVSQYYNTAPTEVTNLTLLEMMTHTSGYQLADDWIFDTTISLDASVLGILGGGTVYAGTADEKTATKSTNYFVPGEEVGYSDIGMQIAGAIAAKKTSKDFDTLFQERIATKMNMKNAKFTAFDGVDGQNTAIADGLVISMKDYANFLKMLLNKGNHEGTQVLSEATVGQILKDYTGSLPVNAIMKDLVPAEMTVVQFGIGCWVYGENSKGEPNIFSSPGIHGFENYIDVDNGYLMVLFLRTTTDLEPKITELSEGIRPLIQEIVLNGKPSETTTNSTSAQPLIALVSAIFLFFLF